MEDQNNFFIIEKQKNQCTCEIWNNAKFSIWNLN
jgi:hypothetical protein